MNKIFYKKIPIFFLLLLPTLALAQVDEEENPEKYVPWNHLAQNIGLFCIAVALFVALGYFIKLATTKGNKEKYDFINRYEITSLWIAVIILIAGICFVANSFISHLTPVLIGVRIFVSVAMGLIMSVVIQTLLKFYYPFYIEKRLKDLRYQPRVSPKTGKPMKLLSELEEDIYLDEGMRAEETVLSVDYDVWKDEETGYIQIEKYSGHLHAQQCPECNYQTFKIVQEEIVTKPTNVQDGEVIKHYLCSYCSYKAKRSSVLKRLGENGKSVISA